MYTSSTLSVSPRKSISAFVTEYVQSIAPSPVNASNVVASTLNASLNAAFCSAVNTKPFANVAVITTPRSVASVASTCAAVDTLASGLSDRSTSLNTIVPVASVGSASASGVPSTSSLTVPVITDAPTLITGSSLVPTIVITTSAIDGSP